MDKKYEIIIFWSSEDNAYIAEVPELPGCMADGKTYREALDNHVWRLVRLGSDQEYARIINTLTYKEGGFQPLKSPF